MMIQDTERALMQLRFQGLVPCLILIRWCDWLQEIRNFSIYMGHHTPPEWAWLIFGVPVDFTDSVPHGTIRIITEDYKGGT